jgi:imidazolonepropionase
MSEPAPSNLLIEHAAELLTMRSDAPDRIGRVVDGSVLIVGERIVAVGAAGEVERQADRAFCRVIDARGKVVMPGFVDCHTHLIFGGSRVEEYAAKVAGLDTAPLARAGIPVGITGTMSATRALSVAQLVEQALPRLAEMLTMGTTTVESKSGYGLTSDSELRMLRANRELARLQPIELAGTFLGAHALPPDQPRERYLRSVVEEMIPLVAEEGLAEFCDAFCEEGYFTLDETRQVLEAGKAHGLKPKLHLDQYSHTGAARMAAELPCVSVDHLNFTPPEDVRRLAEAGVIGVVMAAIDFAVAHPRPIAVRELLAQGLTLGIATDLCPGCWLTSMPFVIALACRLQGLPVAEALRAATLGGAMAIGRQERIGSLEPGKQADVLILDVGRHEDVAYRLGRNAVETVVKRGDVVVERAS